MAQIQHDTRIPNAIQDQLTGFLEKQIWRAYKSIVPLGYYELADGWITVNPEEAEIVGETFDIFLWGDRRRNQAQAQNRIW